jgi:sortase (surface protein transpeptidase)
MATTLSRRRLAMLLPIAGLAATLRPVSAQNLAEATPADLPTSLCLPPEPDDDSATCRRGPVPVALQIAAIAVDAPIEVRETIGGVMQQPSDETHVAWYKETARLGETGNLLLAGHLNWWGVPEAVFFRLGELRPGDAVVLVDADTTAFTYTVEWVRQESTLAPPAEEVLGMTAYEAVTLITCGGEWNSSISEYDERTVVRARRDPETGTPEA